MGWPMAQNLMKAGYEVVVFNRTHARVDEFIAQNPTARAAESPKDVAQHCRIVITMLPTSADVESVALGENGVIESIQSGDLFIDMSTIDPATSTQIHDVLAIKGAGALDAPVSGGDVGAINGTLSIMVGGSDSDFQRALPLFEAMGSTVTHVGAAGAGQIVKACNQIVVAIAYQAVSEALVLGSKSGVDPRNIAKVLDGGLASTAVLRLRGEQMMNGDFTPGGRLELHLKDLGIALDAGKALNVPLPVSSVIHQKYVELSGTGQGELDHSALLKLVENAANHRISWNDPAYAD
jgi:2-hydroxy-3-oxopropionate reductase